MRALFRFLRSRPGRSPSRSKTRRMASATRMYSPLSTRANSQTVSAMRGIVEVPPPTRISKPRTSLPFASLLFGDEAEVVEGASRRSRWRSWRTTVLNLRGRRWQIGLRSMLRA